MCGAVERDPSREERFEKTGPTFGEESKVKSLSLNLRINSLKKKKKSCP